jgi:UDP-N-acetylmuramate dehydrogenase
VSVNLLEEEVAMGLKEKLGGLECEFRLDEPLSGYTTFQVGGPADALALPGDERELVALLERCRSEALPVTVLGGGANTLVRDGGVRGVVICLAKGFRGLALDLDATGGPAIEAGAGVKIPALVRFAAEGGWEGVECLSGVPGTVGGALAMNAGGAERFIGEVVESIRWVPLAHGGVEALAARDISFSYRSARLPEPGIVSSVRFRVAQGEPGKLRELLQRDARSRRKRQPWGLPCAGSIFRNPPGARTGLLVEEAGLKGKRIGGAELSEVHGNFIVNRGGAQAVDVLALVDFVRGEINRRHGDELVLELQVIGEDGPCAARR